MRHTAGRASFPLPENWRDTSMYQYMSSDRSVQIQMFFDGGIDESDPQELLRDRLDDIQEILPGFELEEPISPITVSGLKAASMAFNSGDSVEVTHNRSVAVMTGPKEALIILGSGPIDDKPSIVAAWNALVSELEIKTN